MTLYKNDFGIYAANIKDRVIGRLHISLRTKRNDEAVQRYAALTAFVRDGDTDLIDDLRKRRIHIAAIARCVADRLPFSSLRSAQATPWPSLAEAAQRYLAWIAAHPKRSTRTHEMATSQLRRMRAYLGDTESVARLPRARVVELAQALRLEGCSEWTVSLYLRRLRALYNWLIERESIDAEQANRPVRKLAVPVPMEFVDVEIPRRTRWLEYAEAERLVAATPSHWRFAVLCGLLGGLRMGEMASLQPPPRDVDLTRGLIVIQPKRIGDDWWRPKNRSSLRAVPMNDVLKAAAEAHVGSVASDAWMYPGRWDYRPVHRVVVSGAFERIVADAGLAVTDRRDPNRVTYHTLRHTFIAWLVMANVPLLTIARLVGHSDTDMIESTYGHLSPGHKRAAVQAPNNWLDLTRLGPIAQVGLGTQPGTQVDA